MVKVTGTLQASTEIMKASNSLIKLPQLSNTMREMSAEMMKVRLPTLPVAWLVPTDDRNLAGVQAGIMTEMLDDTMETLDEEDEELEDEAQAEVDKVLYQITDGKLGQVDAGKVGELPQKQATGPTPEELERDEEMERAIQGLLSS